MSERCPKRLSGAHSLRDGRCEACGAVWFIATLKWLVDAVGPVAVVPPAPAPKPRRAPPLRAYVSMEERRRRQASAQTPPKHEGAPEGGDDGSRFFGGGGA